MSEQTTDTNVEIDIHVDDDSHVDVTTQTHDDENAYLLPEEIEAMNAEDDDTADTQTTDTETNADTGNTGADTDGATADKPTHADNPTPATDTHNDIDGRTADNVTDTLAVLANRRLAVDEKFDDLTERFRNLGNQYTDGDISEGDYQAEKLKLEREMRQLEREEQNLIDKQTELTTQKQVENEQQIHVFQSVADEFLARPENAVFTAGSAELQALDQQIQLIASNTPQGSMSWGELFDKARATVATYMDLPKVGTDKADGKADGKADDTTVTVKVKSPEIPPHLGMMPSAVNNSVNDKFAHLDKLEGVEYDQALARLSEADQAEYLKSV